MQRILTFLTLALAPFCATSAAELKLAAVFSDHMVLQRDKPVPVWGWADPEENISVEFADQKQTTTADATGKWLVKLAPLPANANSRTLVVRSEQADRKVERIDVLVGEVWLGSGQSNMAMTVNRALDFETEQKTARYPLLRMFTESSTAAKSPQADCHGKWEVCSPDTVKSFSATLYFFGRDLHRELNVPIGLINSSVGGTPIESWIAAEAQAASTELKTAVADETKAEAEFNEAQAKKQYEQALARWQILADKAKAAGKPTPKKPVDSSDQRKRRGGLGGLFNGKIAPLIPFAIRGVLWYQGEANSRPGKDQRYQHQLPLLVTDWRSRWGEELPFAWVQLPNYERGSEGWPIIREAMLKSLRLPRTGMAITIDIGEAEDIHPKNKQDVGHRLAFWALGEVYGKQVAATSGPLPLGHEKIGSEIVVRFKHTQGGLKSKEGELQGFVIAGEDQQWKPAKARIEGDKVFISHGDLTKPVAVRYAWARNPICNLINGAGLPASPFRTDDWPVPNELTRK